jgi:hypothetical protein
MGRFRTGMANIGASESLAAMHRLKERIETLSEQQAEAMKTAMFKGMTSGEAKEVRQPQQQDYKAGEEAGDGQQEFALHCHDKET